MRKHFDSTIVKITADGDRVASTYMDDDETLVPAKDTDSGPTTDTQPTMTSDDSNTNTVGGEQEATPSGSGIQGEKPEQELPTDDAREDKTEENAATVPDPAKTPADADDKSDAS
jgi:hypothetical protein